MEVTWPMNLLLQDKIIILWKDKEELERGGGGGGEKIQF